MRRSPRPDRITPVHPHRWLWEPLQADPTFVLRSMFGAKAGLHVAPRTLGEDERPAALAECPGTVARLDEQVIEPASSGSRAPTDLQQIRRQ